MKIRGGFYSAFVEEGFPTGGGATKTQIKRTIDARIIDIIEEGEVAPEHALVRVFIEGSTVPIHGSIVFPQLRAKALLNSLGVSYPHEAIGASVKANYLGSELKDVYAIANPAWQ